MSKKVVVVPGEFLTVEEEFSPGKNTLEDGEGNIYSSKVGETEFNEDRREVEVREKTREISRLTIGSVLYGRVKLVKDSMVLVEALFAEKNGKEVIPHMPSATLMVSRVSRDYVKSLRDEFKAGDIIKAKVVEVTTFSIELSTAFPEYGVLKAFCSKCRNPLNQHGKELKCLKCGSNEKRKTSADYVLK